MPQSDKPKIKLSELTEMYDIEKEEVMQDVHDVKTEEEVKNFTIEIEELISKAEKKQEQEFRDGG